MLPHRATDPQFNVFLPSSPSFIDLLASFPRTFPRKTLSFQDSIQQWLRLERFRTKTFLGKWKERRKGRRKGEEGGEEKIGGRSIRVKLRKSRSSLSVQRTFPCDGIAAASTADSRNGTRAQTFGNPLDPFLPVPPRTAVAMTLLIGDNLMQLLLRFEI